MTFHIDPIVEKIISKIVLETKDGVYTFKSGKELKDYNFGKRYEIKAIQSRGDVIYITVVESPLLPEVTWCEGKEVSFF